MKGQPRDPNLDLESVKLYREICHFQANHIQREAIAVTVTNLRLWEVTLVDWQLHGYNPRNVLGMLNVYKNMNGNGRR